MRLRRLYILLGFIVVFCPGYLFWFGCSFVCRINMKGEVMGSMFLSMGLRAACMFRSCIWWRLWAASICMIWREWTQQSYVFEILKEGFGWVDFDLLLENDLLSLYTPSELKEIICEDMLDEKNRKIFQTIKLDDNPVIVRFKLKWGSEV